MFINFSPTHSCYYFLYACLINEIQFSSSNENPTTRNLFWIKFGLCNDSLCGTKEIEGDFYMFNNDDSKDVIFNGSVLLKIPYDDTLMLDLHFRNGENENSFKNKLTHIRFNKACSDAYNIFYSKFMKQLIETLPVKCPIPEGRYPLRNIEPNRIVDASILPPILRNLKSYFAIYVKFLKRKTGNVVGCFETIFKKT